MPLDQTSHLTSDGEEMARAAAVDLDANVRTPAAWNVDAGDVLLLPWRRLGAGTFPKVQAWG